MNHFEVYRFWSNFKHGSHFRNLFVFVVILLRARVSLFIYIRDIIEFFLIFPPENKQ